MAVLLVSIVITIVVFGLLSKYGNLQNDDVFVMVGGSLTFSAINSLSNLLIALFTIGATSLAIAYFLGLLISGGLAYYFLKRAGII